MLRTCMISALLGAICQGKQTYERFEVFMETQGYTWEPMTVTTSDGYILTTFHVTGTKEGGQFTPTMPPVLINHGDNADGTSWISDNAGSGKPMHLQLADAGYDVFIANNRGTVYSQKHVKYDAASDGEYWEYTWADMGLYDDTANITAIKQLTGAQKVFYIGYS